MFDTRIIQNNLRGIYVEMLVTELLNKSWNWTGSAWSGWDSAWSGWDIEHDDKTRIEVKQSAAQQNWEPSHDGRSSLRFDIRAATGYWENGITWIENSRRPADIYVFSWHGVKGTAADQRNPKQWEFIVLSSRVLPEGQKSIGLRPLQKLANPIRARELDAQAEKLRLKLRNREIGA